MANDSVEDIARALLARASSCVSTGIQLDKWGGPFAGDPSVRGPVTFYRENMHGQLSESDLEVPYSELAMRTESAGRPLIAWRMAGNAAVGVFNTLTGGCDIVHGAVSEVLSPPLHKLMRDRGQGPATDHWGKVYTEPTDFDKAHPELEQGVFRRSRF